MNLPPVSESWSMAYLIGWPIWVIVLVGLWVVTVALIANGMAENDGLLWGTGAGVGLLAIGLTALFWSPFGQYPTGGSDYHKWKPKQGEVTQIAKRQVASGDAMQEKIVVVFKGSTQEYGVEDTRAALVEKGDLVALKCKKAYEWGGVAGYDCKFIARVPKDEATK